jgi:hypothetical protein
VFGDVVIPGYTPKRGRFGFFGRTGSQNESHWVDDLSITAVHTLDTSREPVPGVDALYGNTYRDGVLHITDAVNGQQGAYVVNELTPGSALTSFTATMDIQIGSGSADGADGMSFNFANDLPDAVALGEDGVGTGLSICIDNYSGGTAPPGPAIRVKYAGLFISSVQVPKWNSPNFIPMIVKLDADGTVDVTVDGTNVFENLATPYVPSAGRFGIYGRTGGLNQRHWVDNLVVNMTSTGPSASFSSTFDAPPYPYGTVTATGGNVTYTPAADACGQDTFYYVVTDGQEGGISVGTVNVDIAETNPLPPVIDSCPTNRTVTVAGQYALPDLRSELTVSDSCGVPILTQDPAPGTLVSVGTTNVITLTATDSLGLFDTCQATIIVEGDAAVPTFIPGSVSYSGGTFSALFQTANGVTYEVEYTDSLTAPVTWTLLEVIVGDGTIKPISDPGPLPPTRYYRIVIP